MYRSRWPKGVYAAHTLEWFTDQAAGGRGFIAASVGQLSYVELFNDSNANQNLWVYGVTAQSATANELVFEYYSGQKKTTDGFANPLNPLLGSRPGHVGTHYQTICIGTEIGVMQVQGNNMAAWPYPWPCAIIPPGWSFSLHTSNTNSTLSCGFWWVALPD